MSSDVEIIRSTLKRSRAMAQQRADAAKRMLGNATALTANARRRYVMQQAEAENLVQNCNEALAAITRLEPH